jgi:hypothetical protein
MPGTTVREMDPMKKEVKEKAFINSLTAIGGHDRQFLTSFFGDW